MHGPSVLYNPDWLLLRDDEDEELEERLRGRLRRRLLLLEEEERGCSEGSGHGLAQRTEAGFEAEEVPEPRVFVIKVPPVLATSFSMPIPAEKVMRGDARMMCRTGP